MPTCLSPELGGSTQVLKRGVSTPTCPVFYRLPALGIGRPTSFKEVDQQAAREVALTWLETVLADEQLIHDMAL
jgi:trimethylamine:corrinoid methyltransferase-like protein